MMILVEKSRGILGGKTRLLRNKRKKEKRKTQKAKEKLYDPIRSEIQNFWELDACWKEIGFFAVASSTGIC